MPKTPRVKCSLCGKSYVDLLKHLSITHDIGTIQEYNQKMTEIEREEAKKRRFSEYVEDLKEKVKLGKLTWEQYRNMVKQWIDENPTSVKTQ